MEFGDVKGLHNLFQRRNFSHRFFEDLDELEGEDFDSFVMDVNVPYSTATGSRYVAELFAENKASSQAQRVLGRGFFDEAERNGQELLSFHSTPYSRMRAVDNIPEGSTIYLPDITEACISKSPEHMEHPEGVLAFFNDISDSLDVSSRMNVDDYFQEDLESANMIEDEALVEASQGLENPVVFTYDADLLEYDIPATTPEIAYRLFID